MLPRAALPTVGFPVPPPDPASRLLAMQFQLEQSSRWPEAEIRALQFRQIGALVTHCHMHVPFMRERLDRAGLFPGRPVEPESWARLPVLTRRDVQEAGTALHAGAVPDGHGKMLTWATSGSTGTPVQGRKTELTQHYWMAFNLRDLIWHPAEMGTKLAGIRRDRTGAADPPHGRTLDGWGPSISTVYPTGPAVLLDIRSTPAEQAAWLQREQPSHLVTFPGVAAILARHFLDNGIVLRGLRTVRTYGEVMPDDLRDLVRAAWDAELIDAYSAEEVGFIALQCSDHTHYHVQSENALVEILRDDGTPCRPGELGRVIVTHLHNFAMPLLRYELGDIAEVGQACACGRRLPVIKRIVGKTRQSLLMPDGTRRYTNSASKVFGHFKSIVQAQVAQTELSTLEVRLVSRRRLTPEEEAAMRAEINVEMGAEFAIGVVYMDTLPRSPVGKFHTFRCEIP